MEKTYFDKIKNIIQTHHEVPIAVQIDVLSRTRDWLEMEHASENDQYIKRQYEYLLKWL